MQQKLIQLKYDIAWSIGVLISFIIYYSGTLWLYEVIRIKVVKKRRTIVLMYHRISNDNNHPSLTVKPHRFTEQMLHLKNTYQILSISELVDDIEGQIKTTKDRVAITFDDGFNDNYSDAFPILQSMNIPATIFVVSRYVDTNPEMLTSHEIEAMNKSVITFGSHTCTHPILSEIDFQSAVSEISASKTELEQLLGKTVNFFAYPKGKKRDFNQEIKQQVQATGYRAAFITENGEIDSHSDLFALKRIGMRNYPLYVFRLRISGIFESWPFAFFRKILALS